jgi:hypothetical protein
VAFQTCSKTGKDKLGARIVGKGAQGLVVMLHENHNIFLHGFPVVHVVQFLNEKC